MDYDNGSCQIQLLKMAAADRFSNIAPVHQVIADGVPPMNVAPDRRERVVLIEELESPFPLIRPFGLFIQLDGGRKWYCGRCGSSASRRRDARAGMVSTTLRLTFEAAHDDAFDQISLANGAHEQDRNQRQHHACHGSIRMCTESAPAPSSGGLRILCVRRWRPNQSSSTTTIRSHACSRPSAYTRRDRCLS
jgi:hypothetical protein